MKQKIILCDLDGTISINTSGRGYYDDDKYDLDSLNVDVMNLVKDLMIRENAKLLILTGRMDTPVARFKTKKWLDENNVPYTAFHMRPNKDFRSDYIFKREEIEYFNEQFDIIASFDDRSSSCQAARDFGILTYQVANEEWKQHSCPECSKYKLEYEKILNNKSPIYCPECGHLIRKDKRNKK